MIGRLERLRTFLGAVGVFCLILGLWVSFRDFLLGFILIVGGTLFIVVSRGPRELAIDLLADSTPVDIEKAKWPRQIIVAAALSVSVVVMGYGWPLLVVLGYPLFDVISPLWGSAGLLGFVPLVVWGFFSVVGVLFGAWGLLAVWVSATVSAMPLLNDELAALLSISALLVALIPAWAFRYFKCDPRIKTSRDGAVFMLFGVILANIASTIIAHALVFRGFMGNLQMLGYTIPWWFFLASFASLIFGFPLLLIGSRIVVKVKAYCRGWFS